jgi:hypothetical protein
MERVLPMPVAPGPEALERVLAAVQGVFGSGDVEAWEALVRLSAVCARVAVLPRPA